MLENKFSLQTLYGIENFFNISRLLLIDKFWSMNFSMENFKKKFNSYFSRTETLKADIQLTQKQIVKSIILCGLVRLVLIIENSFAIHFIISITNNFYFLLLLILPFFILLDTVYLCVFRNGRELPKKKPNYPKFFRL